MEIGLYENEFILEGALLLGVHLTLNGSCEPPEQGSGQKKNYCAFLLKMYFSASWAPIPWLRLRTKHAHILTSRL